ncbi:MAG TPA: prepilin-type N-terminal cleavage/methylation domain-containing protein [Myxococcales bacterium]|jgi:general secretion pathway protein I
MKGTRGFTLLEVMISLAILAVALVAISGLNGGAVQMHAYSRRATEATMLLRGKMLDVEEDLQKNGFSDFNDEKHGDFNDEGSPDYAWSAEILKPDVQLDPTQMLNLVSGATGGGLAGAAGSLAQSMGYGGQAPQNGQAQNTQGGPTGSPLGGAAGGMLTGQMTTFIETLKKSVREVRLAVSWQDGKERKKVEASQIIVILPELVGTTGDVASAANTITNSNGQTLPAQQLVPRSTTGTNNNGTTSR